MLGCSSLTYEKDSYLSVECASCRSPYGTASVKFTRTSHLTYNQPTQEEVNGQKTKTQTKENVSGISDPQPRTGGIPTTGL